MPVRIRLSLGIRDNCAARAQPPTVSLPQHTAGSPWLIADALKLYCALGAAYSGEPSLLRLHSSCIAPLAQHIAVSLRLTVGTLLFFWKLCFQTAANLPIKESSLGEPEGSPLCDCARGASAQRARSP